MDKTVGRRRPHGRRRLLLERKQYFELMEKGYSNTRACEIVGINVRTGREWKNGAVWLTVTAAMLTRAARWASSHS